MAGIISIINFFCHREHRKKEKYFNSIKSQKTLCSLWLNIQKILQNPCSDGARFFRVKLNSVKILVIDRSRKFYPVIAGGNCLHTGFDIIAMDKINIGIFNRAAK